jgi:hypothetical protein
LPPVISRAGRPARSRYSESLDSPSVREHEQARGLGRAPRVGQRGTSGGGKDVRLLASDSGGPECRSAPRLERRNRARAGAARRIFAPSNALSLMAPCLPPSQDSAACPRARASAAQRIGAFCLRLTQLPRFEGRRGAGRALRELPRANARGGTKCRRHRDPDRPPGVEGKARP